MSAQTFIVKIAPDLARRVRQLVGGEASSYSSFNEFVEVALENQLGLEAGVLPTDSMSEESPSTSVESHAPKPDTKEHPAEDRDFLSSLLQRPAATAPLPLAEEGARNGTLSTFTNRLSPIKVAVRVLANMATGSSEWPAVAQFREDSADTARYLGLQLQAADSPGQTVRRSVAYPIGPDPEKAKARFINSFALSEVLGEASGPLVTLGLANVAGGRAVLTRAGWRLAAAPSPLIESSAGLTLSPAEAEILRAQIKQSPDEIAAVREFIDLVRQSRGRQEQLDEMLAEEHLEWTREIIVAHRSAMLGRLGDLGALQVIGRGVVATITLLESASQLATGNVRDQS